MVQLRYFSSMHAASSLFVVGTEGKYAATALENASLLIFILGMYSNAGTIIAIFGKRMNDSGMRINSSYRFADPHARHNAHTRRKKVNVVVEEMRCVHIPNRHIAQQIHWKRLRSIQLVRYDGHTRRERKREKRSRIVLESSELTACQRKCGGNRATLKEMVMNYPCQRRIMCLRKRQRFELQLKRTRNRIRQLRHHRDVSTLRVVQRRTALSEEGRGERELLDRSKALEIVRVEARIIEGLNRGDHLFHGECWSAGSCWLFTTPIWS